MKCCLSCIMLIRVIIYDMTLKIQYNYFIIEYVDPHDYRVSYKKNGLKYSERWGKHVAVYYDDQTCLYRDDIKVDRNGWLETAKGKASSHAIENIRKRYG